MALRALIFDVDGTLANTERDGHRPAFNAAFAEAGLSWHWDEAFYGSLLDVAGGLERIRHYAKHFDPATAARPDEHQRAVAQPCVRPGPVRRGRADAPPRLFVLTLLHDTRSPFVTRR